MRLSFLIPLITFFFLFSTVLINIGSLWYSFNIRITTYIQAINPVGEMQEVILRPDGISALTSINTLDKNAQEEYQKAISDLSNISTSLQNLADNPELYIVDNKKAQGNIAASANGFQLKTASEIPEVHQNTLRASDIFTLIFTNPFHLKSNSPEYIFLFGILQDFLLVNGIWFLFVIIIYLIWIKRIFFPIQLITNKVQDFLNFSHYSELNYTKKDEFQPLIRALNELHASLMRQDTIRSNFLSDISHEIRTPMTAVKCLFESVEDGIMELDESTISLLQNEIERLVTITERIMTHERFLHTIDIPLMQSPFLLQSATENILTQHKPQLLKNNQIIDIRVDPRVTLTMDQNQYSQILHNIFSNFIKYAGNKSTLIVHYRKDKRGNVLTFEDNGVGMNPESLPLAREKFYRGDFGRNQNATNSMGIGLSIIDRIVSLHHGSLRIHHTHPHGFSITIFIPFPSAHDLNS